VAHVRIAKLPPPSDDSTSALRAYERGDEPTEDDRPENTQDSGRPRSWRRPKEYYSGRDSEAGYEVEADKRALLAGGLTHRRKSFVTGVESDSLDALTGRLRQTRVATPPKHFAEKILTSRSALEGERKQVTVLFADVKGSTELAGELDPEEWHAVLNRFFSILSEGVHRYEGTINQYTGDGIMALFGAPIAHEDHAQRACYAALHLKES